MILFFLHGYQASITTIMEPMIDHNQFSSLVLFQDEAVTVLITVVMGAVTIVGRNIFLSTPCVMGGGKLPSLHHGREHMTDNDCPMCHGCEELYPNTTHTYTSFSPFQPTLVNFILILSQFHDVIIILNCLFKVETCYVACLDCDHALQTYIYIYIYPNNQALHQGHVLNF